MEATAFKCRLRGEGGFCQARNQGMRFPSVGNNMVRISQTGKNVQSGAHQKFSVAGAYYVRGRMSGDEI